MKNYEIHWWNRKQGKIFPDTSVKYNVDITAESEEKAKEIFKKLHSNVFISAIYEFTGKADYHEKVIN